MSGGIAEYSATVAYAAFNIISVSAIVVVNKMVFKTFEFHFPTSLVGIHSFITWMGLSIVAALGFFEKKELPQKSLVIMALSFIGYNVASLANLNVNPGEQTPPTHTLLVLLSTLRGNDCLPVMHDSSWFLPDQ